MAEVNDFFMKVFDFFGLNEIHDEKNDDGDGEKEGGGIGNTENICKPI